MNSQTPSGSERLTMQGDRVIRPQNIVESDIPQWISDLEREVVRLRGRIQSLEDTERAPGDMRPSERIAALERALQLKTQECEELRDASMQRDALSALLVRLADDETLAEELRRCNAK